MVPNVAGSVLNTTTSVNGTLLNAEIPMLFNLLGSTNSPVIAVQ